MRIVAPLYGASMSKTPHLLLLDASGFAYRAFHSANPVYRERDGQPIGACLAFMALVWRMLGTAQADPPTHGAAVFDAPGKTFRHRLAPDYKANRPQARNEELSGQMVYMRHAAETLGFRVVEAPDVEADDTIATLATRARKAGMRTTVVSSDKDFGQIVEDGWIEIYDPLQKRRMLAADIEAKMGVPPALVPHLQALWGDAVDNIIGVDGVGRDKAARLVRRWGDVEGVLANAKEVRWAPVRNQLVKKAVQDRVRLNLKLATLRRNVKLPVEPADLVLEPVMKSHLIEILRVLGAPHYMEAIFALDPQIARPVPAVTLPVSESWWLEELSHPGQAVPETPQCGYYHHRLVHGGPWVGARIWREPQIDPETGKSTGMELLRCEVAGKPRDPAALWVVIARRPIKKSEYDFRTADAAHAKKWRPDAPAAQPHRAIDLTKQPAPTNPRLKRKSP